jgi:hypothetical protein
MDSLDTAIIENEEVNQRILETVYRNEGEVRKQDIVDELREEGFYEGPQPDMADVDVDVNGGELAEAGYLEIEGDRRDSQTFVLTDEGRMAFEMWAGLEPSVETGYQEVVRMLEMGDLGAAREFLSENYDEDSLAYDILSEVYENRTGEEPEL